jgi:hypothetical protein
MSGGQAARWLGIGQPAVQRSVVRGGKIARGLNLVLSPDEALKQALPIFRPRASALLPGRRAKSPPRLTSWEGRFNRCIYGQDTVHLRGGRITLSS